MGFPTLHERIVKVIREDVTCVLFADDVKLYTVLKANADIINLQEALRSLVCQMANAYFNQEMFGDCMRKSNSLCTNMSNIVRDMCLLHVCE